MQSDSASSAEVTSTAPESVEGETEYPLFIWQMVVPGTKLRSWIVAISESEVREVLVNVRVSGEKEALAWVVEDVTPLEATPHVVCIADGGDIGIAKEKELQ